MRIIFMATLTIICHEKNQIILPVVTVNRREGRVVVVGMCCPAYMGGGMFHSNYFK